MQWFVPIIVLLSTGTALVCRLSGISTEDAILRAVTFNIGPIDSKLGGVLAMFGSIAILFVVPWLDRSKVRSAKFRPLYRQFFWVFVAVCIGLGYLGSKPAEGGYVIAAQVLTFWYFFHFIVILPVLSRVEKPKPLPASIAESVLGKNT